MYDIHFRRKADTPHDYRVISCDHETLEAARASRVLSGDLVVHGGTTTVVADEAWL